MTLCAHPRIGPLQPRAAGVAQRLPRRLAGPAGRARRDSPSTDRPRPLRRSRAEARPPSRRGLPLARPGVAPRRSTQAGRGQAARTPADGRDGPARLRCLRLPLPDLLRGDRPRRGDEPDPLLSRRLGDLEGPQADPEGAGAGQAPRTATRGPGPWTANGHARTNGGLEDVARKRRAGAGLVAKESLSGPRSAQRQPEPARLVQADAPRRDRPGGQRAHLQGRRRARRLPDELPRAWSMRSSAHSARPGEEPVAARDGAEVGVPRGPCSPALPHGVHGRAAGAAGRRRGGGDPAEARAIRDLIDDDEPIRGWDVLDVLQQVSLGSDRPGGIVARHCPRSGRGSTRSPARRTQHPGPGPPHSRSGRPTESTVASARGSPRRCSPTASPPATGAGLRPGDRTGSRSRPTRRRQ